MERRTATETVLAWLVAAVGAELALLTVTGVYLLLFYRPTAAQSWGLRPGEHARMQIPDIVRLLHRVTSTAMVLTVLALAAIGVALAGARSLRSRRHGLTAGAAIGVAFAGLLASFTGFLLPWDRLALWAVSIGSSFGGYRFLIWHRSQVQYVLIGHAQISPNTLRGWLLIHVLAIPAVLVGLGLVALRRLWRHVPGEDRSYGHTGLGS